MVDIDKVSREEAISLLGSDKWQENVIAVAAVLHHGYFDEEAIGLVKSFAGSDIPVPSDRKLGDLVDECLEKAEALAEERRRRILPMPPESRF